MILSLPVKCDNVERKCQWVGNVGTLKEHVDRCEFTLVPCTRRCKDGNKKDKFVMRRDLKKHLKRCPNRIFSCEYCGQNGTFISITNDHEICPKKLIACPNSECEAWIQRQQVQKHITMCPYTVVTCKYSELGCYKELQRRNMDAHECDETFHFQMSIDMTVYLKRKLEEALDKIKSLEQEINSVFSFKVPHYQDQKNSKIDFESPSIYTSNGHYQLSVIVDCNGSTDEEGTYLSVYASVQKGRIKSDITWPFEGAITITLLNQLKDCNHWSVKMTQEHFLESVDMNEINDFGDPNFILHSDLGYDADENTQYLKDDTLYFRVSVENSYHKPWLQFNHLPLTQY